MQSSNDRPPTQDPAPDARTRRVRRAPLWLLLLCALLALLVFRPDIRAPAASWAASSARHLLFDVAGVSPRTVYSWRLRVAGLYNRPLGRAWQQAVERAQDKANVFDRRYASRLDFPADTVSAKVLTTHLQRGQALQWRLRRDDASQSDAGQLYASLEYRQDSTTSSTTDARPGWQHLAELTPDDTTHRQVAAQTGDYRLVFQPELSASVHAALAVAAGGSIDMPVVGARPQDIGGGFGVARDGGKRSHKGVDIFAARNTPVRAVIDGRALTGNGGLGGHYIFLSGGLVDGLRSANYYYAHLDHFAVANGEHVTTGDVLGYVGNSGNAAGGPPHLHFGIYTAGGAVDPAPFIAPMLSLPTLPATSQR